jgi:23S rRNA pseudouridine1911/1915/1917 synthase
MTRTESFVVEKSFPRIRLDTFLRERFAGVSRGVIQRLIEQGCVLVDGKSVKPTHFPKAGETISMEWPEVQPAIAQPESTPLEILFEDADLLVINKPPGMVVHPAPGHSAGTLVNALLGHCAGQLSGIGGVARPGIVHRLDKDTSGCMVVAKNDHTHLALSAQFANRETQKYYETIVCGAPKKISGEIMAPIGRDPIHRQRMAVLPSGGRAARTSYEVIQRLPEAALLKLRLYTGRTHQIRVHLQHLGCPVVGDKTYGQGPNKRLRDLTGYVAPRQLLHAARLVFNHPTAKVQLDLSAPLPSDFALALITLAA